MAQLTAPSPAYDRDLKAHVSGTRLSGLLHMLDGYRLRYAGATTALGIGAAAKTSSFLLLQYLVDEVLMQAEIGRALLLIALSFLGLALVESAFSFLSGKLAAETAEGIVQRLKNYLFDHLQRLNFTYHDNMATGELIQRVTSDVDAIRRFYAEQALGVGRILLLFGVNLLALLTINWQLALFSIIIVPLLAGVSIFFFKRVFAAYEKFQEQDAKLSTTLQENLSGVRVVKAFARQDYEIDKFDKDNREHYRLGVKMLLMHAFYWPTTDILAGFQMLAGYVLGAFMVMDGTMTLGGYLAYVGLVFWIIEPMRGLGRIIVQASTGLVSYERVASIIREDRETLDDGITPDHPMSGAVAFENVSFAYDEESPVLYDITFEVGRGQTVALIGSTGSGKTSLVNLLPRFYEYTGGRIMVDGVELCDLSRAYLRANIGIVEQEPFLFSRTLRENISYGVGRAVTEDEIIAAARAADFHHVAESFPEGYQTIVGEKGVTLSGGQKQRVAIARTLLKNPPLLIMDDSTSAVDTETEANIRAALDGLMANRTTFVIAHRVQSVMNADLILVLDQGRIVQRGTHEELVDQPGFYQQIYDLQARVETELQEEIAGV